MPIEKEDINQEILEDIASLEHEQWMAWSKSIAKDIRLMITQIQSTVDYWRNKGVCVNKTTLDLLESQKARLERWEKLWIPYVELSEEWKESDREYAMKVLCKLALEYGIDLK